MEEFIEDCINKAKQGSSKCISDVLGISGMSGTLTRHLYNNLCSLSKSDNTPIRYLEIGCHQGSSTISALYKNNCIATVIDNWSEFGNQKTIFEKNLETFCHDTQVQVINEDSFDLKTTLNFAPYDIYLYDGHHGFDNHIKAITDFVQYLADTSIILVDDYDWPGVQEATRLGFEKAGGQFLKEWYIPGGDSSGFWNGCGIFLYKK